MSDEKIKLGLNVLDGLSEEEKQLALTVLKQISATGTSEILEDLKYSDFEEIPVDIDTFLDDDEYLGRSMWMVDEFTGERKCTLFPYWRETLHKIFPDNLTTKYNTLILTGAIGLGKTQIAVTAMAYLLYRMLCLKDPYSYYGMMPNDKISFSMLNITLDAAQGVGWDKLQQMLQASDWFMEHGNMNASRTNPQWKPPKGIELIFGSNNRHVVGRALFCNMTDEVNFGIGNDVEKKKAKQKKMIAQIDARMKSRFMKGTYLPTLNIIISSKDTEQAFLESYINTKRQNESKTTLIIDEPQWIVRNDKGSPEDPGSFYVAVGNKVLAHELLPVGFSEEDAEKYREKGYSLVKVPPGFREDFETNLDQALMDIAGMSTSSMTKYISGVRLNQAKVDTYRNPFTKDVIEVGNSPDDHLQYANFFDLKAVNPTDMSRPMFIHLDLSTSGDKTGIAGVWITGKRPQQGEEDLSKELQYKLAFSVSIKAPKGYQISFEKTKTFIYWLRDRGFVIKGVSSDTFDKSVIQELGGHGFKTQFVSVDRVDNNTHVCLPYAYLKTAIYERHLELYRKCDQLTDELIGLERMSSGKIDHTTEGINSKDQADAVCGALYLASQFAEQFAYDYGENLNITYDVNMDSDTERKRQMIVSFQEELTKIYTEIGEAESQLDAAKKEEWQRYKDIADGIIVI